MIDISDKPRLIKMIKDIDVTIMQCLNARNQVVKLLANGEKPKRDYKLEQEFITAASKEELFPGTAYAIWPVIMDFGRELL